jgi:hypothetical protein
MDIMMIMGFVRHVSLIVSHAMDLARIAHPASTGKALIAQTLAWFVIVIVLLIQEFAPYAMRTALLAVEQVRTAHHVLGIRLLMPTTPVSPVTVELSLMLGFAANAMRTV